MTSSSQYEYLLNALDSAPFSISEIELNEMILQIDFFLFEFNVFGDSEEIDEVSDLLPTDILADQLAPEFSKEGLARWYWALANYLRREISNRGLTGNVRWVNEAINAINLSATNFSKHELHTRRLEREIRLARSSEGTQSNNKRYAPLDFLKQAAFGQYEPAITELELQRKSGKKKTDESRTTYQNIARIITPKITHLNKDHNGQRVIGRNGDPVGSLARILKEAVAEGKLRSTRGR